MLSGHTVERKPEREEHILKAHDAQADWAPARIGGGGLGGRVEGLEARMTAPIGFDNAVHVNCLCGTDTVPSRAHRVVVQSHVNP
jgi:hypothetical protein